MQSQKFTSIVESMQRGETLVALKTISTLTSKEKNKAKLSENELKMVFVLKALCLSKIHEYGESHNLITNFLKNEKDVLFSEGNVIHWLDYIASSLHLYKEVREFSSNIYNKAGNKEEHLVEYMNLCIKESNYHEVFSAALRLYKLTNNVKYMFINVIYQYKATIRTANESELPKKLELVFLFTEKLLKELKIELANKNQNEQAQKQAIRFSLLVCKKQQKLAKVLEILLKYPWAFDDQLEYLQHFFDLYSNNKTEENRNNLINMHYIRFQKDQDLDNFVMEFNIYEQFIAFLFKDINNFQYYENFFVEIDKRENKDVNLFKLPKINSQNDEILLDFLVNLVDMKKFIRSKSSHKNFKSALQIFCCAEIVILQKSLVLFANDPKQKDQILPYFQKIVQEYIKEFSITMTFAEEFMALLKDTPKEMILGFLNFIELFQKNEEKPLNKYIREISLIKMRISYGFEEFPKTVEGVVPLIRKCLNSYEESYKELDLENKQLEKGERHFIDDFLLLSADFLFNYIRQEKSLDQQKLSLVLHMIITLEAGLTKSPYNFDIKLRLVMFYELMGCPERCIEIIRTLDIKSIQHETLGFLYSKIYLNYNNMNLVQDLFTSALNFYAENLRESKESILSCLKNSNYDKLDEFEMYDKWVDSSYFKQICLFVKLETFLKNYKFDSSSEMNIEFYIQMLKEKITQQKSLTWNIDLNVLRLSFKGNHYYNLLDLFNSFHIFKLHFLRIQLENHLRKPENFGDQLQEFAQLLQELNCDKIFQISEFQTRKPIENIVIDNFTRNFIDNRLKFEICNLEIEKNLFSICKIGLSYKQEEKCVEEMAKALKDLDQNCKNLGEYFSVSLKKEEINVSFSREILMNVTRYMNKTIEIIQKFLRLIPEIIPIINKTTKKGEEELKKRCIFVQKTFNSAYKELIESTLKNLTLIQDYFQIMHDLNNEWGKTYKEILKDNNLVNEGLSLKNQGVFKIENIERLVLSTLLTEYTLFSTLQISNAKELSKSLKSFKV